MKKFKLTKFIIYVIVGLVVAMAAIFFVVKNRVEGPLTGGEQAVSTPREPRIYTSEEMTEIKELFRLQREQTTQVERDKISELGHKFAIDTAEVREITIGSGCVMDPLVVRAKRGDVLVYRNIDSETHGISVTEKNIYSIPPGETQSIKVDFDSETTTNFYAAGCDGVTGPGGNDITQILIIFSQQ